MPTRIRMTHESAPAGGAVVRFPLPLAGLNLAITAMVAPCSRPPCENRNREPKEDGATNRMVAGAWLGIVGSMRWVPPQPAACGSVPAHDGWSMAPDYAPEPRPFRCPRPITTDIDQPLADGRVRRPRETSSARVRAGVAGGSSGPRSAVASFRRHRLLLPRSVLSGDQVAGRRPAGAPSLRARIGSAAGQTQTAILTERERKLAPPSHL